MAADPRLDGIDLMQAIDRLQAAMTMTGRLWGGWKVAIKAALSTVVQALSRIGVIPGQMKTAFLASGWPSVPGMTFEPLAPTIRTKDDLVALLDRAARLALGERGERVSWIVRQHTESLADGRFLDDRLCRLVDTLQNVVIHDEASEGGDNELLLELIDRVSSEIDPELAAELRESQLLR